MSTIDFGKKYGTYLGAIVAIMICFGIGINYAAVTDSVEELGLPDTDEYKKHLGEYVKVYEVWDPSMVQEIWKPDNAEGGDATKAVIEDEAEEEEEEESDELPAPSFAESYYDKKGRHQDMRDTGLSYHKQPN